MGLALLPDWLAAELPPVQPHGRVCPVGTTAVVYVAPDGRATSFDSVAAAYAALHETDVEFSEDLLDREDALGQMITFPSESEGCVTAWIASNDSGRLRRLRQDHQESLALAESYHRGEESSFIAAFRYLDTRPAFWIRRASDSERARWFWETTGHMNRVHLTLTPDADGAVIVELETGMHTPDMTEHYHDLYLDAAGATFEQAVVTLARHVAVSFNDNGTETGDKPPNPWADEVTAKLDERIEQMSTDRA